MQNLLEVRNLNKRVGDFSLKDINLTLEPGYIMGLLGVNGAGKTTLINSILNLYQKDSGQVLIEGMEIGQEEKRARDRIGFVLDENMFEKNVSVWTTQKGSAGSIPGLMKNCSVYSAKSLACLSRKKRAACPPV